MAQHIGIVKIDEHNKLVEESEINFVPVINELEKLLDSRKKFPCLSSVDPYGDTIFNRVQVPFLIKELKRLQSDLTSQSLRRLINEVIKFTTKVQIHNYVKFIGD